MLGWFVGKEMRCQVEPAIGEAQTVKHHRLHRLPDGDLALLKVLRNQLVDKFAHSQLIKHPCYQSQVLNCVKGVLIMALPHFW